jgi:hypothetical protein
MIPAPTSRTTTGPGPLVGQAVPDLCAGAPEEGGGGEQRDPGRNFEHVQQVRARL